MALGFSRSGGPHAAIRNSPIASNQFDKKSCAAGRNAGLVAQRFRSSLCSLRLCGEPLEATLDRLTLQVTIDGRPLVGNRTGIGVHTAEIARRIGVDAPLIASHAAIADQSGL